MQEVQMRGVQLALEILQVIAHLHALVRDEMVLRQERPLEMRKWRNLVLWPHVHPDDSAGLVGLVSDCLQVILERARRWLRGLIDTVAVDVELPAVIHATNT